MKRKSKSQSQSQSSSHSLAIDRRRTRTQPRPIPTEAELRETRIKIIRSAQAQRPSIERDLDPYLGMDPETAAKLKELFPAPKPDVVLSRKLRIDKAHYKAHSKGGTAILAIPIEVQYTCGWRPGDVLLISAWAEGCARIVRLPVVGE